MKKLLSLLLLWGSVAHAFTVQIDTDQQRLSGWASSEITFDVNFTDCVTLGVSEDQLNTAVDAAFSLWNSTPGTSLKLIRGSAVTKTSTEIRAQTTAGNPMLLCDSQLGTDLADPGEDPVPTSNIPAVTTVLRVDTSRRIALALISLNAESDKAANVKKVNQTPNLLSIVIAHEVGHALGLGHSADVNALMYYDTGDKNRLSLAEDDMTGITYLYPRSELGGAGLFGCGTLSSPRKDGGSDGDWGAGMASLALFFAACFVMKTLVKPCFAASIRI